MEQRSLRLGDIVDDYCPRERRLTNHAIVAVVGDDIQQTRCSTCDAEHPYKQGKAPRRKKKDPEGELYDQVLAGVTGQLVTKNDQAKDAPPAEPVLVAPPTATHRAPADAPIAPATFVPPTPTAPEVPDVVEAYVTGHRPLIRATLPRIDGQPPVVERRLPEFTMRQPGMRGGQGFRNGHQGGGQGGWQDRNGNPPRHGQGRGGGDANGFRGGQPDAEGNTRGANGVARRPGRRRRHGKRPQ